MSPFVLHVEFRGPHPPPTPSSQEEDPTTPYRIPTSVSEGYGGACLPRLRTSVLHGVVTSPLGLDTDGVPSPSSSPPVSGSTRPSSTLATLPPKEGRNLRDGGVRKGDTV